MLPHVEASTSTILLQDLPHPNLSHKHTPPNFLSPDPVILSTVLHRQAPPQTPAPAHASNPPPSTGSSLRSFSSTYHTITNNFHYQPRRTHLLAPISNRDKPLKVLEIEIIKDVDKHTRHLVELGGGSWHEKQMFPEESFAEVEWGRIEEGWRKGQGYLAGKDSEG